MDLAPFEQRIGYVFENKRLIEQAFTHRSFLNENRQVGREHNERLEFLGDAVLELVVTEFLYEKYPEKAEGELTAVRAALVNTQSIYMAADTLGMNDFLFLSRGESKDTGRARQIILANAFEAVIGAIYLDSGYDSAKMFIADQLFGHAEKIVEGRLWQDAKSRFQEVAQEKTNITPSYQLLQQSGPDHDKRFVIGVFLGSEKVAQGEGRSKQEAEQAAAEKGLQSKGW
jgi:ribonuclease-3